MKNISLAAIIVVTIIGFVLLFWVLKAPYILKEGNGSVAKERELESYVASGGSVVASDNASTGERSSPEEGGRGSKENFHFPVGFLPLFFPQDVENGLKRLIGEDFSIVYGDVEEFSILDVDPPKTFESGGRIYQMFERIEFFGPGRFFPEELNGLYIYESNGRKSIFVSDEIIAAYESAQERMENNRDVFRQLEGFLQLMNTLENAELGSPESLLHIYGNAKDYEKKVRDSLIVEAFKEAYGKFKYRSPSILEVKRGDEFDGYLQDLEDRFVAKIYVYDHEGRVRDGSPPFVYDEGKWKLLIVVPGT